MTPTEYRQFCETTYCAPAHVDRHEYLLLLLIEEVGEVASLFAKSMRDGHEVDRERLMKELGDVMWTAVMMDDASKSHVTLWRNYTYADMSDIFISILTYVAFSDACELCLACGFGPEAVALANVEKLKSRQARGVLHGSGDER